MIIRNLLILIFIVSPLAESANLNAFGKKFSLPEDCVFRVHNAIHAEPTFFCDWTFVSFISKESLHLEEFRKEPSIVAEESYRLNNLDVFRFTTKHGDQENSIVYFGFICERNDCISVSGQKIDIFYELIKTFE